MAKKTVKINFSYKLPVTVTREGGYFVAYTSALDLATSAKTFDEAKERFKEIVTIFFEELVEKGTLEEVLELQGWRKIKNQWQPAEIVSQEEQIISVAI